MIIKMGSIEVFFPKDKIYPEQMQYIKELYEVVQGKGHCLIEMPTGTGKTVSILSFLMSYQIHLMTNGVGHEKIKNTGGFKKKEGIFKIVYCTRTTAEIQKVLEELKELYNYIRTYIPDLEYLGVGLAARRTLCVNENVNTGNPSEINRRCKEEKNTNCPYYKKYTDGSSYILSNGIHTLSELREETGGVNGVCPYYTARSSIFLADCIVYTYNYMIDPRINELVCSDLGSNCAVVFDEAHNIDSVCVEVLSVRINRTTLDKAWRTLSLISDYASGQTFTRDEIKRSSYARGKGIKSDFSSLLESHKSSRKCTALLPGSLRTVNGFISAAKRIVEFFKAKLKDVNLSSEPTDSFVKALESSVFVDYSALVHLSRRLRELMGEMESLGFSEDYYDLSRVCDFCSLAGQFKKGFSVIFEPFNSYSVYEPVLHLSCLDSSIAAKRVLSGYRNVIITSGTLSPISIYPRLLDFIPVKSVEIDASSKRGLCALIVTKGSDQMTLAMEKSSNAVSTTFSLRTEPAVVRNYGNLLLEMAVSVPDGLVCFFPSYKYLEEAVSAWSESGMIKKVLENKLIFVESFDHEETERALEGYRQSCESGRGGIMLSVARGKVSEGVDFSGCYGRGVLVFGVPYQYTENPKLKKRLEFLGSEFGIRESEFLSFDAMRQTAQCIGRVLRSSTDYGLAVLADRRFNATEKKTQLPRWIQRHLETSNVNLSIDMSVAQARQFFRRAPSARYYN
ncbi:DNA excision repair protein ERCC-2 [Nematocida minor]|uniref:DNA excision repair protein ERCC-2 n=1 Tax=Nematocida minor TaxID=1912983 RepID=UPI002220502E|nr:DNA excision repair protein ERCC-2 [Nematocida minor]KAI5192587.1 DNA excision repair protein ERCC-2 [Nematocida minor]